MADAIVQLEAAVNADPTYAEAHLALANALAQQGRNADAAIERQKAQHLPASAAAASPPAQP
jgi:Tfp pilus assembly protein PilF